MLPDEKTINYYYRRIKTKRQKAKPNEEKINLFQAYNNGAKLLTITQREAIHKTKA